MAPGSSLLDLGCGEGRHALAAAKLGFSATAIDYEGEAPRSLVLAFSWGPGGVTDVT